MKYLVLHSPKIVPAKRPFESTDTFTTVNVYEIRQVRVLFWTFEYRIHIEKYRLFELLEPGLQAFQSLTEVESHLKKLGIDESHVVRIFSGVAI